MERRATFLALRWVATLAVWLYVIYNRGQLPWLDARVWTVTLGLVLSNLVLTLVRPEAFQRHRLYFYTFVVDLILVSVAVYLAGADGTSFFAILLLCLFAGALSGDLRISFLFSVLASVIYVAQIGVSLPRLSELLEPSMLLRVPLLVVFTMSAGNLARHADRRPAAKAALLVDFDRRLSAQKPPEEIAATVVDLLEQHGSFKHVGFYIYDRTRRTLNRIGDAELPDELHVDQMPETIRRSWTAGAVIQSAELERVTEWCRMQRLWPFTTVMVPAHYSARPQGLLLVECRSSSADIESRLDTLRSIADRAASALIHARLIETAQESAIGLHSLLKINETVSASLRSPGLLELLEEGCTRLLNARAAHLFLVDPAAASYAGVKLRPVHGRANDIDRLVAAACLSKGEPVILNSAEAIATLTGTPVPEALDNLLAVPLRAGDEILGVIEAVDKPGFFIGRDVALLGGFAGQAAVALENARLYGQMKERAERIEALAAVLEQEKHKLEHVLANMEEGVILLDANGVSLVNHAGKRLLEPRRRLSLPAAPDCFADPLGLLAALEEVRASGAPRHDTLTSGERYLSLQAIRLDRDEIAGGGAIAVVGDITELVRVGEKRSEFVSQVSHELRTPLSAIVGAIRLLVDERAGTLSEVQSRLLTIAEKESNHLMELINDLLDLSKLEAGSMKIEHADVDLGTLLHDAAASMENLAADKNLEIVVEADAPSVSCDPVRIRQVVLNLLGNAIKFTEAGGSVRIVAEQDDRQTAVKVIDTGVGIPEDKREAVFEKFEQAGPAAARKKGTGLGLAIARQIVERHGGHLTLNSEVGVGSTFCFTLPANPAMDARSVAEAA